MNSTSEGLQLGRQPKKPPPSLVSVVIPAYNEGATINRAISDIVCVLQSWPAEWEIIIVDDGSEDGTFDLVRERSDRDVRIKGIRFSRNFGKEAALLAGLESARGEAVITMDADLQHPPRLIPELIDKWQKGAKIVSAVKIKREKDSVLAGLRAAAFNRIFLILGGVDIRESSDYKLLDRHVVDTVIHQLREIKRFYRGLVEWVGYTQVSVPFEVETRCGGKSKWSLRNLLSLAVLAITSFTVAPLRIVTLLGFVTLVVGLLVAVEALWSWFHDEAVSGFTTIIISLFLIGSSIMISLGIIGEYIAKIYEEIKQRPHYLIDTTVGYERQSTPDSST